MAMALSVAPLTTPPQSNWQHGRSAYRRDHMASQEAIPREEVRLALFITNLQEVTQDPTRTTTLIPSMGEAFYSLMTSP